MIYGDTEIERVLKRNKLDNYRWWCGRIQLSDYLSELWKQSINYKSFVDSLLQHDYEDFKEDYNARKLYCYLSKLSGNHWYRIRSKFGEHCFKTYSDVGSLLVNNNTLIHNGYGDGVTRVAVFKKDDENHQGTMFFEDMMQTSSVSFSGKLDIYDYDIKGKGSVIMTVEGDYVVYTYEGLIALVEI